MHQFLSQVLPLGIEVSLMQSEPSIKKLAMIAVTKINSLKCENTDTG